MDECSWWLVVAKLVAGPTRCVYYGPLAGKRRVDANRFGTSVKRMIQSGDYVIKSRCLILPDN